MHMRKGDRPLYTLLIDRLRSFKYLLQLCVEHEYAQSDLSHFLAHNFLSNHQVAFQRTIVILRDPKVPYAFSMIMTLGKLMELKVRKVVRSVGLIMYRYYLRPLAH